MKTIPHAATTLAFSPQGKLLASGHDSNVRLWSTESWQEVRSLPDARYPAVFSPDGQWLVTGTAGGYRDGQWVAEQRNAVGGYLVWNTATWERTGYCAGGPTFAYQSRQAVAFSPDGKLLVTAGHKGGREVGQFQVWDFPSLTVRTNFTTFPFKLGSAAFAPDGKHLLIGDNVRRAHGLGRRQGPGGGYAARTHGRDHGHHLRARWPDLRDRQLRPHARPMGRGDAKGRWCGCADISEKSGRWPSRPMGARWRQAPLKARRSYGCQHPPRETHASRIRTNHRLFGR